MDSRHITPELLDAIIERDLPPAVLSRLIWDHVRDLCPHCRENLDRWLQPGRRDSFGKGGPPWSLAARAPADADSLEGRAARREVEELLEMAASERLEAIEGAGAWFRDPFVVDLLIERVQERIQDDPRDSVHLARLARKVAERTEGLGSLERRVRSAAHLGNALRASGDVLAADRVFKEARHLVGDGAGIDSRAFAEVDRLEASLRRDQKNYGEAEKLLARAVLVFNVYGDAVAAAKSLLKLAAVQSEVGDREKSLELLREAIDLLDPEHELALVCLARHSLAILWCDHGDFQAASEVLDESRELFERYFRQSAVEAYSLKYRWLEGRIARGVGELDAAEAALREAAEGFVRLEVGYDAALAYLDLAELYLAQGRMEEVAHLAAAVEPVLKANDLAEEAVAALALFRGAATREHLTTSILDLVRGRVRQTSRSGNGELR